MGERLGYCHGTLRHYLRFDREIFVIGRRSVLLFTSLYEAKEIGDVCTQARLVMVSSAIYFQGPV